MSEMTCRFGTVLQDYYLDKVRSVNARRDARFAAMQTREDVLDYIAEVREKIAAAFPMPEERGVTPEVVVTSAREYDKFRMECVIYYSRPGYPVTANLYLPKVDGKVPAVIVACGHSPNGKARDFYSKAGITFAEMGYAALVVDPVGQGERWQFVNVPDAFEVDGRCTHEHNMTGKLLSLTGEFFGAWRVYDLIRGLDYLLSLPQVDASRVGITGTSGGGTLTAFTQALEPRFTMAAPSCYITSWQRNIENEIPADIEQMPPGLLAEGLEMGDLLLPLAPRPILILGQDNDFFDPRGTVE
ncbi:MAG: acetylxylan esterase, partial [Victivallales bacterium]|nr:acetylxylan esterase [Victivallales bacterium]